MSVDKVAAELREAIDHLPFALLTHAATCFDEARAILTTVTQGTSRPEVGAALQALGQTVAGVAGVHGTASRVKEVIETYLADVAGGEPAGRPSPSPPAQSPAPRPAATPRSSHSGVDKELLAELLRQGRKLSPDKVVRVGKTRDGETVWLEDGTPDAGLQHLMDPSRVANFADKGVLRQDIVDLVFTALAEGEPIGTTGRNRVVHAVTYQGRPQRVAVTVGSNGYIIGANPVGLTRKIKPLP